MLADLLLDQEPANVDFQSSQKMPRLLSPHSQGGGHYLITAGSLGDDLHVTLE